MTCFVCRAEAEELPGYGGDYRFMCGGCGEFRVSTTLHSIIGVRVFDVERARAELDRQRVERRDAEGLGAKIPVLASWHEDLLRNPE